MSVQLHIHVQPELESPRPLRRVRADAPAATLVRAAAAGDPDAWEAIVRRYGGAIRAATRGFRLSPADADDVMQTTWMRLLRSIDRLQDADALGSWLLTTARRESLRFVQTAARELPTDEPVGADEADACSVEERLAEEERAGALRRAVEELPGRQRALLGLLLQDAECSYDEVAARLEMPIGSIGPTRERSLARLRADEELVAVLR
jgi:RNA polymerase sigma factor (sigma-70 family)